MTVEVDAEGLKAALRLASDAMERAAYRAMATGVSAAEQHAKSTSLFKDRRPKTRSTIRGEASGTTGKLRAGGAVHFLENGTRPHVIEARPGKILSFVQNGVRRFAKRVYHPGTKPRPFMRQAGRHWELVAGHALEEYAGRIATAFNSAT